MDTIPPLSLPILLDGATGSELYKRGMPAGACTEQWVLGHPEALLELQRGYVAAGSQVLIAPTFGANRVRLEQHGIFGQVADYNRRLVELSRQAAGGRALVAGDMAPTGLFIAPFGESSFEELVAIYTEQAAALAAAGVDLFLIETTMTMPEARAAVLACKSVSDRPVWVTFTCDENGRTLSRSSPPTPPASRRQAFVSLAAAAALRRSMWPPCAPRWRRWISPPSSRPGGIPM